MRFLRLHGVVIVLVALQQDKDQASYFAFRLRRHTLSLWDTGKPEPLLVEFVILGRIRPARTLDIGAG